MNAPSALDWSHLQSFVAVAEHGALSAAARATGSSQPTLSRHIASLEEALGARLFERSKAGVTLTERGAALLVHASKMADAAAQLRTAEVDSGLAGTVRITASQIMATFLLPQILTELHHKHPDIEIELVASDDTNNLLRREADIAVRMYRPTQLDVIATHCGDLPFAAYAAKSYIARRGMPGPDPQDLLAHDVIGYDRSTLIIEGMRAVGLEVDRDFFCFRSDDQVVCWHMVRAGMGVGFNQSAIATREPDLVCVSGPEPLGHLPIWLTAHPEVKKTPRIRKVFDHLRTALVALTKGEPGTNPTSAPRVRAL